MSDRETIPAVAADETLLGYSTLFVYVGLRSGYVESRGRPEAGTMTTGFGPRDYWRSVRSLPGFVSGATITAEGAAW